MFYGDSETVPNRKEKRMNMESFKSFISFATEDRAGCVMSVMLGLALGTMLVTISTISNNQRLSRIEKLEAQIEQLSGQCEHAH